MFHDPSPQKESKSAIRNKTPDVGDLALEASAVTAHLQPTTNRKVITSDLRRTAAKFRAAETHRIEDEWFRKASS